MCVVCTASSAINRFISYSGTHFLLSLDSEQRIGVCVSSLPVPGSARAPGCDKDSKIPTESDGSACSHVSTDTRLPGAHNLPPVLGFPASFFLEKCGGVGK